ncbi:MAG: DUF1829 domain-containing protein [Desulfomonile sp.]|jgi:Domain of unknown function DUF1829/Domain of unknown function DUF1828
MIEEIQDLVDKYITWLKDKTMLRQIKDWVEITTPYLDRHNDYLQLYVKRQNGGFLLTDDGYVVDDLEQSGCKLESAKRQELLRLTLNGFGVQINSSALEITASIENFTLRKHNLIQAMLAVNDLFYLAAPSVESLFYEDVVSWLDTNGIRFTPRVKFTGKSGYDHLFDFVIPKSRLQPERLLQTINRPKRDSAQSLAFSWMDTRDVRPPDSKAYAILNDSEADVSRSVMDALTNYGVSPVPWSKIEKVKLELAA